jgi:chromodomain-helicase-DNA-binding protein 1
LIFLCVCAELNALKDPTKWRLPAENLKATLNWSCEWGATDDAMLLVGAWKHGFGNWETVEKDESLGLQGKLFLDEAKKKEKGKDGKPRIPNAVHLVRRGTYLLEVLRESSVSHVKSSQKPAKRESTGGTPVPKQPKKAKTKANGAGGSGSKPSSKAKAPPTSAAAPDDHHDSATNSKKRRRTPEYSSSSSESDDQYESMDEEACKEALRPVKRELKRLKQSDELPREDKLRVLRECLSAIGGTINKSLAERRDDQEKWRKHLWVFVGLV